MKRLHILVEGQTEEALVRDLLVQHLMGRDIFANPILLTTKRVDAGPNHRGGVARYRKIRDDLRRLLNDTTAHVTTMIDYYGLPGDFPGVDDRRSGRTAHDRVLAIEHAWRENIASPRFIPYVSLHETEALLLVDLDRLAEAIPGSELSSRFRQAVAEASSPEEINDGPDTHPAARIEREFAGFRKTLHGPLTAKRIGLARIRAQCPHFDSWLRKLESLSS